MSKTSKYNGAKGRVRSAMLVFVMLAALFSAIAVESAAADSAGGTTPEARKSMATLTAGDAHTCAIDKGGVKCWGENGFGQLGNGRTSDSSVPVTVKYIKNAVALSSGGSHTCALLNNGRVACWGRNDSGQLGNGQLSTRGTVPELAIGVTDAVAIGSGLWHTCAVRKSGKVACWGGNWGGQVGDFGNPDPNFSPTPVNRPNLTNAVEVSARDFRTCALLRTGKLTCWGWEYAGVSDEPTIISKPTAIAGYQAHSCAVVSNGDALCWGNGASGQMGTGSNNFFNRPAPVVQLRNVTAITAGYSHTCAIAEEDRVFCWGSNEFGQLGDETTRDRLVPRYVDSMDGAVAIATGKNHSCVRGENGSIVCWGNNSSGQLGDGTRNNGGPVRVRGL